MNQITKIIVVVLTAFLWLPPSAADRHLGGTSTTTKCRVDKDCKLQPAKCVNRVCVALATCGTVNCAVGEVCCNDYCGICTAPGGTCANDCKTDLDCPVQQQAGQPAMVCNNCACVTPCGPVNCALGKVCCDPLNGVCTAPGGICSQGTFP